MSPRKNRARRPDDDEPRPPHRGLEQSTDGEWTVRSVFGGASTKTYLCPGCLQNIRPGVAHVVAWPAGEAGDAGDRRHWHTGCWHARDRRGPGVERSRNAPRYG